MLQDGVTLLKEPDGGAPCWTRSMRILGRKERRRNRRPEIAHREADSLWLSACEGLVAFALALRVAMTEFENETK